MKEVENYLNNLLEDNDTIVLAVSGGPDSMCLLHILLSMQNKKNLKLICAHINHNTRLENKNEADMVKQYCLDNNIIFEYEEIKDYKNNKFTESEGREKRYQILNDIVNEYAAKYLMTAHHGDDLMETILMRIVRGSNLKGYLGIFKIINNTKFAIVRPLLYVDKEEILTYVKKNNIPYAIDKTNELEIHTRNRYRKHMLPFLKEEDKNVHLKFLKYSEELESYHNYINKIIKEKIKNIYKENKINIESLLKEDEFIQRKIIEYVIEELQKQYIFNISDKQFNSILELLKDSKNKKINLANDFIARRSYNYLYIEKNSNIDSYHYIFDQELKILNKYHFELTNNVNSKSNYILRLNSKEVKLPLIIRNMHNQDIIKVKNLNGTKKVNDIFKDIKLDQRERMRYPIVTDSQNRVIWIPGIKKSIFDKEISEKCDIIIKYTEE